MKMNLGIDIDGCLNDFQKALAVVLKRDYNIEVAKEEYEMLRDINLDNMEQCRAFWEKYNPELFNLLNCECGASDVLKSFYELGINLNIATAREYHVAPLTEKWLNEHNIFYDNIFFNAGDKVDLCKWQNIPLMIEDKPYNAMALANNGIKVLLFSRPYNLTIKHENITRVNNWDQVYDKVVKSYPNLIFNIFNTK